MTVSITAHAITPSDPFVSDQWYLERIQAPLAWDKTTGSRDVVVAVLDTGVDLDHPDLRENFWRNEGEIAGDWIDNDGNGYVDDVFGWDFVDQDASPTPVVGGNARRSAAIHGSLIAGILGASGNNGEGIAGIAWQVSIMPVRILDADGSGDSVTATQGVRYAVQNGAQVINLSFTGFELDPQFGEAVRDAYQAGVVVVAAVGNHEGGGVDLDATPIYPACFEGLDGTDWVIGVAASDKEDDKAVFSNFGMACVDIAAPGVDIVSTSFEDASNPTFDDRYTGGWSGTSMAAPMVTGAVVLLKTYRPALTPGQILSILQLSADPLKIFDPTLTSRFGTGRLHVARALEMADAFLAASALPSPLPTPPSITPSFPDLASSPVTGLSENVSPIAAGDFVRSPSFSTVYYITPDFQRRPFLNTPTFLTHTTFDQIKLVTDATLPLLPLASPMLPKHGVVLVKIESDPHTYAVDPPGADGKPILRYIPSESEAIRVFGLTWADYVLDVPVTAWRLFAVGPDLGSTEILPTSKLKTRDSLR